MSLSNPLNYFISCLLFFISLMGECQIPILSDMQTHMEAHLAWPLFYRPAPDIDTNKIPAHLTYKHARKQTNYEPLLRTSGVNVIYTAAYTSLWHGKKSIIKQLEYIEVFEKKYNTHYQLCKNPSEVNEAIQNNKIALVQSIEGAHKLIKKPEDAKFWAERGVALITPIHLSDREFGGSIILPGFQGFIINARGILKKIIFPHKRGLTPKGKDAIHWIAQAGIMVDLSHMSKKSAAETLEILAKLNVPPVVTHGHIESLRHNDAGLPDSSIIKIYKQKGIYGINLNSQGIDPYKGYPLPEKYCPGTIDAFMLNYDYLSELLKKHGIKDSLIAIGWASDFNGMVNHLKPKYGKEGCYEDSTYTGSYSTFATQGITSAQSLDEFFKSIQESGLEMNYLNRAGERLLEIWGKYLIFSQRSHSH